MQSNNKAKPIHIAGSILSRAIKNDRDAIETMFRQFLDETEAIEFAEFLGVKGILGIGEKSFSCITPRRVASLQVSSFGELVYQDGFLEDINSNIIYQPSLLPLYIFSFFLALFTFGIGLILLPLLVSLYYKIKKCGIVCNVKEGYSVYFFCDRKRITAACRMLRKITSSRERRI